MENFVKRAKADDDRREAATKVYSQDLVAPTGADEEDAADFNQGRPVKRLKQAKQGE